ncbi:MAG: hypothetical protein ACRD9S_02415 [Pyrinomonadaceae bacterium]
MSKTTSNNNTNQHNNRREFLKSGVTAAAGLGFLSLGLKAHSLAPGLPPEDAANTHNMMIVGVKTAYISHLPMFEGMNPDDNTEFASPHRRQVIMEATFSQRGRDLTSIYLEDRLSHPEFRMYTLRPSEFILGQVDPGGMALKKFEGNAVFRGHLERRPRTRIIGAQGPFEVNVKNVIHFHKFNPQGAKPARLEYLLFGKGPELFLAHFITLPNDFDQIVSVKVPGHGLTDEQLAQGMHVIIPSRDNAPLKRLKEKQKAPGEFQLPGVAPKTLPIEVVREFYFEESELDNDGTMGSTKEETDSGFPSRPFVERP